MAAAVGSQLTLVEGSDSSCWLQELSLVPLHLGANGEVSPPPHVLGYLTFRVMAALLEPPVGLSLH